MNQDPSPNAQYPGSTRSGRLRNKAPSGRGTGGGLNLLSTLTPELQLRAVLNDSLTNGLFFDTKFYVFSRRRLSGVVDKPLEIFANSAILKVRSPYFVPLLSGNFAEGARSDLYGGFPSNKEPCNEQYIYGEDSDLEDEEEHEAATTDTDEAPWGIPLAAQREGDGVVPCPSLDDGDSTTATGEPGHEGESLQAETPKPKLQRSYMERPPAVTGLVVVKPDVAFKTFHALIHYLYTDAISFSPLRSDATVALVPTLKVHDPHPCSPKSMYRIASELQIEPLKKLARDNIREKLTPKNALLELFSVFTSLYPEVQTMEIEYIQRLGSKEKQIIGGQLQGWMKDILEGHHSHALPALISLTQAFLK